MYGFGGEKNEAIPQHLIQHKQLKLLEFDPDKIDGNDLLMVKFQVESDTFDAERYANDNFDEETLMQVQQLIEKKIEDVIQSQE